jgi:hypothetical protein
MSKNVKVKMPALNWRFNLVELAGSVGASGGQCRQFDGKIKSCTFEVRSAAPHCTQAGATAQWDNETRIKIKNRIE